MKVYLVTTEEDWSWGGDQCIYKYVYDVFDTREKAEEYVRTSLVKDLIAENNTSEVTHEDDGLGSDVDRYAIKFKDYGDITIYINEKELR